ncbi:MAG: tetratricopeptide repeat protein, partial [Polyangiaceae bacterium]
MRSRTRLRAWTLVACVGAGAVSASAPQTARADETSPANVAAARRHFERAKAYYGQGSYREAIGELEAAHTLDPTAKDLVFNLGVVHEKLGDIEDALTWFRLYTTMNLTPPERDRADAYVKRLEGAKKELEDKQAAAAAARRSSPP